MKAIYALYMHVLTNDLVISQSNSIANNKKIVRHTSNVCEGICNRMMLHFSYYWKYGLLAFGDDGTGPADESKRTKRV